MYTIPILLLLILAVIAVAWSPLFALVIAVPAFVAFLAYVGSRPRADEQRQPPTGSAERHEREDVPTGAWGERRS